MMRGRIVNMPIADPRRTKPKPRITIEETGRGNFLCCDEQFGRIFRDDPDTLREICEEFCRQYNDSCEKFSEDPVHTPADVTNYNNLYIAISIDESGVGDQFGWTNTEDYRVFLEFHYDYVDSGPMVEKYGEPIFFFGPKKGCEPYECYREVCG